jgi:hypothetical protein
MMQPESMTPVEIRQVIMRANENYELAAEAEADAEAEMNSASEILAHCQVALDGGEKNTALILVCKHWNKWFGE